MTVKTGHTCTAPGVYKCEQHPLHKILLKNGEKLPPCDKTGFAHPTTWVLVKKENQMVLPIFEPLLNVLK